MENAVDFLAKLLKLVLAYGHYLPSFIFLLAAGILFFRMKNWTTGLIFGGLLVGVAASLVSTTIIQFRLFDSIAELEPALAKLGAVAIFGYLVQAVSFLIFVVGLPNPLEKP
ncbi:MAG: hypothetical protein WBP13_03290 [Methylophilaceae bacterium]